MKASKWTRPYKITTTQTGKRRKATTLTGIPKTGNVSGAYLIYHIPSKRIVYVGKSHTQLYKTIYRHFQKWKRPKFNPGDFGYKTFANPNNYAVRAFLCTKAQADRLELYWIKQYKPEHNSEKMAALLDQQAYQTQQAAHRDALEAHRAPQINAIDIDEVPF